MILTGYFDESGTHAGAPALSVAGYISTAQLWADFEREWQDAMSAYGLDHFHMVDFVHSKGPYEGWPRAKKEFRFKRLVEIINRHILASVGIVVQPSLYESILSAKAKRICGSAYGLAVNMLFIDVPKALKPAARRKAEIAYVFESGALGASTVTKLFQRNVNDPDNRERYRLLSLHFEPKRSYMPLQAADILAYELYLHLPRTLGMNQRPPRVDHLMQLASSPFRWGHVDTSEMRKIATVLEFAPEPES